MQIFRPFFMKYHLYLGKILGRGPAAFINSLIFYIKIDSPSTDYKKKKWICKTRGQWGKEIGYSKRQIDRIIARLRENDLITIKQLNLSCGDLTNHYSLNEDVLLNLLNTQETDVFPNHFYTVHKEITSDKISEVFQPPEYITDANNNKIHNTPEEQEPLPNTSHSFLIHSSSKVKS